MSAYYEPLFAAFYSPSACVVAGCYWSIFDKNFKSLIQLLHYIPCLIPTLLFIDIILNRICLVPKSHIVITKTGISLLSAHLGIKMSSGTVPFWIFNGSIRDEGLITYRFIKGMCREWSNFILLSLAFFADEW